MSKKSGFSRRGFLRGAGTIALGLPFLESANFLGTGLKSAAAAPSDWRFAVFVRQANGVAQAAPGTDLPGESEELFWPTGMGALTRTGLAGQGRAVSVLSDYADVLLPVYGLRYGDLGDGGCAHASGMNMCLTGASVVRGGDVNTSRANGESIDYRIARELNPMNGGVRRDPLTLISGTESGWIDDIICYRGPGQILAAERSPFNAYMRMVGLVGADQGTVDAVATRRRSVNDLVRGDLMRLRSQGLSRDDQMRLDQHLTAVRDVEVSMAACEAPEAGRVGQYQNFRVGSDYVEHSRMMAEIIALAIGCGYTKAATLQCGAGSDQTRFTVNGQQLPANFHPISHRIFGDGADGAAIDGAHRMHHEIDKIHLGIFKHLLDKLAERSTPDGRLLDLGTAAFFSDLASGNHSRVNLPWVFAGGMGGQLNVGNFVNAGGVPHNQMLNTILTAAGVRKSGGAPVDDFGDGGNGLLNAMIRPGTTF